MNEKRSLLTVLCMGALFSVMAPAMADDLDERQADLLSKINQASMSKRLTGKDAGQLHSELSEFDKTKVKTRNAHGGVLSITDDRELGSKLGDINQHFDEKVLPEGAKGADKAVKEKPAKPEKAAKKPKAEKAPKPPMAEKPAKEEKHHKASKSDKAEKVENTGTTNSLPPSAPQTPVAPASPPISPASTDKPAQ